MEISVQFTLHLCSFLGSVESHEMNSLPLTRKNQTNTHIQILKKITHLLFVSLMELRSFYTRINK